MPIIEVNHLTKEFKLGQLHGLRQTLRDASARLVGCAPSEAAPFKALDDVSFTVERGEVLGIIGHNGAGKSTVLKLLAGISVPTRGSVHVCGRIAPLIEVGAGLVGDLTGRENIYLNGAILGMSRAEIRKKFDEIVAFAELENFIDTPLKRYSSGMTVRLGFSIATSVDADVLIVDEVLAVGDLAFQRKCFDRMEEIIKRRGRTVLLVSHNIRQVERMCTRAILLDHGKILADAEPGTVCDSFFKRSNDAILRHVSDTKSGLIRSSGEAEVLEVQMLDAGGAPASEIASGDPLRVRVRFALTRALEQPELIVGTHTSDFVYLTGSSTAVFDDRPNLDAGVHEVELTLPTYPLASGVYCLRFVILDRARRTVFAGDNLRTFTVASMENEAREEGLRLLNLPGSWVVDGEHFPPVTQYQRARSVR